MNIFVAKLNPSTDQDSLKELFSQYGEVSSVKVIMDRDTGRSKCYGFIEMDDNGGQAAVSELNESEFEGNTIVVKESAPRENNDRGGYNRGGGGGGYNRGGGGGGYNRGGGGGYNRGGDRPQGGYNRDNNDRGRDNRGGGYGGGRDDRRNSGFRDNNDRGRGRDFNRGGGDRFNKKNDGFDTSNWE